MAAIENQLHAAPGTTTPCKTCKWHIPDPTDSFKGQCTVNRSEMGAVWKRWIRDVDNMSCSRHETGRLSFREHV